MKTTKKRVIAIMLVFALFAVQSMQMHVEAASVSPSVVCSNFSQLYSAFIQARDGDVIGIDNIISIQAEGGTLGYEDKHITIVRMNDGAGIEVSTSNAFTFKNITFDGNEINAYSAMVTANYNTNFNNATFQDCKAVFDECGGALSIMGGRVNLTDSSFLNNSGVTGGHVYIMNDSQVSFIGCTFEGGSASKGGAINQTNSSSYIEIKSSTIKENTASESGGGIFCQGRMVIEDSKVFDNTAPLGEDITSTAYGNVQLQDDPEILQQIFADENVTVTGWVTTTDDAANTYRKFGYEAITEPEPTDPTNPDDGDNSGTDNPSPSDPDDGTGDSNNNGDVSTPSDSSQNNSGNTTTDNSDHSTTTNTTTDNSDHSSTTNSTNTTTSTDSSMTNSNSGNTSTSTTSNSDNSKVDNSQRTEDNSSVTNNYYQQTIPSQQVQQTQQQAQPLVIHNYIEPSQQPVTVNIPQGQQSEVPSYVVNDPSNNIKINAEGVNVTFEVIDGVYSININPMKSEQAVPEPASSVNWYEVIKIALLAAFVLNMMWKSKEKDSCKDKR